MPADGEITERINELESRMAYQEQNIDKLSDIVREQWASIDRLQTLVQRLERRIVDAEDGEAQGPNERPPHY